MGMNGKYDIPPSISHKYPTNRDITLRTGRTWLEGRQKDDGAEGLWRLYDNLYDFTSFIEKHPGGKFWLEVTKGTDITELFECHHISEKPEKIIPHYFVRKAKEPRNILLTLEDNGFYKTLKREVRKVMPTIDRSGTLYSNFIIDGLCIATFVTGVLAAKIYSYSLAALCGLLLTWTVIAAHNYFHRKDNFRMFYFNLSLLSFREWRISHVLSHHIYPNTLHDLEISYIEPFLPYIPHPNFKNFVNRYLSWIYGPIVWSAMYYVEFTKRLYCTIFTEHKDFYIDDILVPLSLPLTMYTFSSLTAWEVLKMWSFIIIPTGSFVFGFVGLTAAHHHPEITHEGDALNKNMDWGIHELDAVMDRSDIKDSLFLTLTSFGRHSLHHLFPTLDHALLPQLNPVLIKVCKQFELELTECNWLHHIIGIHSQLARIDPNPIERNERNKKH